MKPMSKTAVKFAIKHSIKLGQCGYNSKHSDGHYYIVDHVNGCTMLGGQRVSAVSFKPTAKSAIIMMKRHLRRFQLHLTTK